MLLNNVDFEKIQTVRKVCMGYASDGNTVVKHRYDLYPAEIVFGDIKFEDLYLHYQDYSYPDEKIFDLYTCVGEVCVKYGNNRVMPSCIYGNRIDMDKFKDVFPFQYIGKDGFKQYLKDVMTQKGYVSKAQIAAMSYCDDKEFVNILKTYYDAKRKEIEEESQAELEAQKKAEEDRRNHIIQENEKKIAETEDNIKTRKDFRTFELRDEDDKDVNIILLLMRKYDIKIPLKTQGWVINALSKICWIDGEISYRYYKGHSDSSVFIKYLNELEKRICCSEAKCI